MISLVVFGVYKSLFVCGLSRAREGAVRTVVMQLTAACDMYQSDWGVYPPGCGTGSRNLARYLSKSAGRVCAYMEIPPQSLTSTNGHVANPLGPASGWPLGAIHYRAPGVHNRKGVDIWCADLSGRRDGINNWEW